MRTIFAFKEDGEDAVKVAHRVAMAAAVNSGRAIYVNDEDCSRVVISNHSEILAVVVQK